jgi:hypothetical protein
VSISGATSVKTVANGGPINNTGTQSGGAAITMPFDLVFSSDIAGASKYAWEIESYNGTTGTLLAWVNVPTVSHTADTVFYMVYGDAAVVTQQNTSSFAPSAVWDSSYKGVWHMSDTNFVDSTSNAHSLSSNSGTAATGQVAHHRADVLVGHQDADLAILRAGGGEQLGGRRFDRLGAGDTEPHQPPLGLVGDSIAVELHDDRATELSGRVRGLGGRGDDALLGHRHAVSGEEALGRGL